jgi:dipeptidyl aminopeptidase/acylaminoacyl peptidase
MSKKPAKDFTHTVVRDADYYRRVPKEGDQPEGVFAAGTQVRLLDEKQGYAHVWSAYVTGWVSKQHLKPSQAPFPVQNGKIAFQSFRDGNSEIYTMNADGSNQTNISNNSVHDEDPDWSPDGTKIIFWRDDPRDIYVMNADGSGQTNISNNGRTNGGPTWSPDGTKIVVTFGSDIYAMNADGSAQTPLTSGGGNQFPDWQLIPALNHR